MPLLLCCVVCWGQAVVTQLRQSREGTSAGQQIHHSPCYRFCSGWRETFLLCEVLLPFLQCWGQFWCHNMSLELLKSVQKRDTELLNANQHPPRGWISMKLKKTPTNQQNKTALKTSLHFQLYQCYSLIFKWQL